MKQSFKYTVFALALALVFVCCSMAGMNMILAARERALLSEKGNAIVQSPIRAWETERKTSHLIEIEGEGLKEAEQEEQKGLRQTIELWEMEAVEYAWNSWSYETLHEPVIGQISMEEAIEKGKTWLQEMEVAEDLLTDLTEITNTETSGDGEETQEQTAITSAPNITDNQSVKSEKTGEANTSTKMALHSFSAFLSVRSNRTEKIEPLAPYYSFWNIRFSSEEMSVYLRMNAVTGEVWEAELICYKEITDTLLFRLGERLQRFIELAGVQPVEDSLYMDFGNGDCYAFLRLQDTNMYAVMDGYKIESRSIHNDDRNWELGEKKEAVIVRYMIKIN